MPYFFVKYPTECASAEEAAQLENEVKDLYVFNTKMVRGLKGLYKSKPQLVKQVMKAAASGNIAGAIPSIMSAMRK